MNNTTYPQRVRKGSKHPIAKLTDQDVLEMRALHKNGTSTAELSQKYKVSLVTIRSIVRRASWTHI
jgi:Mor family transcriptional regulator